MAGLAGKIRNWPIQRKLLLIIMTTVAASLLLVTIGIVVWEVASYRARLSSQLNSVGAFIAANSAPTLAFDDPQTAEEILDTLKTSPAVAAAAIYAADGRLFASYSRSAPTAKAPPASPPVEGVHATVNGIEMVRAVSSKGRTLGTLYLSADFAPVYQRLTGYVAILIIVSTALVGGAFLLKRLLQRLVSDPLLHLAGAAETIAGGDLTVRFPVESADELGQLAEAFNHMTSQLSQSNRVLSEREDQLRQSETTLRLAVEATGLGTFDFYPRSGALIWSDLAKNHFGLSSEARIDYQVFLKGLHPEDRDRVQEILQQVLRPGSSGTYGAEYRTIGIEDGKERWLVARGQVFFDDSGVPVRLIGATLDITDRKLTEEAIRTRESDLARAQAAAHLGSWRWDLRNGTVTWSEELYRIFGVDPATFAPSNEAAGAHIHPDDRARHTELVLVALTGTEVPPFESRIVRPGGEERVVLTSFEAEFDLRAQPVLLFGTILDITERKRTDEALRRALAEAEEGRRTLEALMEHIPMGITIADAPDVNIRVVSRFGRELIGKPREAIEGISVELHAQRWNIYRADTVTPANNDELPLTRATLKGEVVREEEWVLKHSDGTAIPILCTAAPIRDTMGKVTGGVIGWLDISDRKRAEAELRSAKDELELRVQERTAELTRALERLRSETDQRLRAVEELRTREQMLMQQSRLAAMGEMLVNISHQWRQPLNVVGLLLQDLLRSQNRGTFTAELLEKNVSRSRELITHMSQTIDDFRSYLNPERAMLPFNVVEVVIKTVALVGESLKGVQVELRSQSEAPVMVEGFRNEYAQVLINILVNARDAFKERGTPSPLITVTIGKINGTSVVTIADNAGGIAPDVIGRIFEPYFTTKGPDKGTGVGLFMSKTIIEKNMGGRLTVRNTGNGSEFRIEV